MASLRTLIPDLLDSDTQYSRYYHQDLGDMQTESLLEELWAIRSRLWFVKSDHYRAIVGRFEQSRIAAWLGERKSRIDGELRRRRDGIQQFKTQPRPVLSQGVRL